MNCLRKNKPKYLLSKRYAAQVRVGETEDLTTTGIKRRIKYFDTCMRGNWIFQPKLYCFVTAAGMLYVRLRSLGKTTKDADGKTYRVRTI